ncbi:MAG: hypothetical protein GY940_39975 [bacterium]|nr:hypothetical protein [bacterium]
MILDNNKKITALAVLVLITLGLGVMPSFAVISFNGAGDGYDETGNPDGTAERGGGTSIEVLIVRGAGYSLQAGKHTDAILRIVEWQNIRGLNMDELEKETDNAIGNIELALETYGLLVRQAEATAYNNAVTQRLRTLNYDRFREANRLNGDIFAEVEGFLGSGDITGIFKRKHADVNQIAALLKSVKEDLGSNRVPDLKILWELNETFSRSNLFGSYVARVFHLFKTESKINTSPEGQND